MRYQTFSKICDSAFRSSRAMKVTPLQGILAAAILGAGVYVIVGLQSGSDSPVPSDGDKVDVVVAKRYIPANALIKPPWVSVKAYPKAFIPPGAIHSLQEMVSSDAQAAYRSVVPLPAGQPITRNVVAELGRGQDLSSQIPPGKVAVSFGVDAIRGAGGWVLPGDKIAILGSTAQANLPTVSKLLFPSMEVIAVDKERLGSEAATGDEKSRELSQMLAEEGQNRVITVIANPLEALSLSSARERGPLSVVLRSFGDSLPWDSIESEGKP